MCVCAFEATTNLWHSLMLAVAGNNRRRWSRAWAAISKFTAMPPFALCARPNRALGTRRSQRRKSKRACIVPNFFFLTWVAFVQGIFESSSLVEEGEFISFWEGTFFGLRSVVPKGIWCAFYGMIFFFLTCLFVVVISLGHFCLFFLTLVCFMNEFFQSFISFVNNWIFYLVVNIIKWFVINCI